MTLPHLAITVLEESQVGEARRAVTRVAEKAGLNETDCGKAAIVATELARNLIKYARGGEMLIATVGESGVAGVEILAFDRGPGMADVGRCMDDGYSTSGTPGQGLGAIQRLSTEFDIYSAQPGGTVIISRILNGKAQDAAHVRFGSIRVPAPGENMCGDNLGIARRDGLISLMLADGLGHGPLAAAASDEAVRVFEEDPFREPGGFLTAAHAPLQGTRGAAVAMARINIAERKVQFAGAGNIAGWIISANDSRALFSHNGTVGVQLRKVQEFAYAWPEHAALVMHSDGLQSRWDLSAYPGLSRRHPSLIAGVLYRDFKRGRDDATIAVLR